MRFRVGTWRGLRKRRREAVGQWGRGKGRREWGQGGEGTEGEGYGDRGTRG